MKEQHDLRSTLDLARCKTVDDLGHVLELTIDLRGADPDAAAIQYRVRATVDDDAIRRAVSMAHELAVVAVAPDVWPWLEVGCAEALAVVAEQAEWLRGKGVRAGEFPACAANGARVRVENSSAIPSAAAVLAAAHR